VGFVGQAVDSRWWIDRIGAVGRVEKGGGISEAGMR